ncbi:MAG: hypothetical protein D6805_05580 [Planctomycetota bacterium]|nr:MAG: hypothetical protein D6805_05580 [Planctomycetota bacterium]
MQEKGVWMKGGMRVEYDFAESSVLKGGRRLKVAGRDLLLPHKFMSFRSGEVEIRVAYQERIYPVLLCSCGGDRSGVLFSEEGCVHIGGLREGFFRPFLEEIFFQKYGGVYDRSYLYDPLAQKIRMLYPLGERRILEEFSEKFFSSTEWRER